MDSGMSEDMYNYIMENKYRLSNIDVEEGLITTSRGNHGTVCSSTGYLRVKLGGKLLQVHQVLAVEYFGRDCIGKQVNHKDSCKTNNKPENLEVVTIKENIQHQWANATDKMNERVANSRKLTDNQVLHLRAIYPKGYRFGQGELTKASSLYGINNRTLHRILSRDTYKHI